jgi:hypothetical protein
MSPHIYYYFYLSSNEVFYIYCYRYVLSRMLESV